MKEGGVRRLVVPPGPLQRQGTKSLVWVVGLSEAMEEAGGEGGGVLWWGNQRGQEGGGMVG